MIRPLARYLLILLLTLVSFTPLTAQGNYDNDDDEKETYGPEPKQGYRYSFLWEVHAPHYMLNEANRLAWKGIAGTSFTFKARVFKNFSAGVFVRGVGFTIFNPVVYYDTIYNNPFQITLTGGAVLSYEVPMGKSFSFIPEANIGYSWIRYYDLNKQTAAARKIDRFGVNINLNLGFYYYVQSNKRLAIGMILGANYFSHRFKLAETGVYAGNPELLEASDKGPTLQLNIGFGLLAKFTKIRD